MVKVKQDLTGWRMSEHGVPGSRLTVIKQVEDYVTKNGRHRPMWLCCCDCGNTKLVLDVHLKNGNTKSCGCLLTETNKKKSTGNNWKMCDGYMVGYTKRGIEFYIDIKDYDQVCKYTWCMNSGGYLHTKTGHRNSSISLHRLIMNPPDNKVVDHINHNPRDNRRNNLRICDQKDNMRNKSLNKRNTTNHTGVYKSPYNGKWLAKICCDYRLINLGTFDTIEEAIQVRKEAEKKYGYISQ